MREWDECVRVVHEARGFREKTLCDHPPLGPEGVGVAEVARVAVDRVGVHPERRPRGDVSGERASVSDPNEERA